MSRSFNIPSLLFCCCVFWSSCKQNDSLEEVREKRTILPINQGELPGNTQTVVILNVNVLDVKTGEIISEQSIFIENGIISSMQAASEATVPENAQVFEGEGMYVMPGLIDAHFHLDLLRGLPRIFLEKGITSLRDPGAWIEAYGNERRRGETLPRLYLTGPHLDMFPPAHPKDALIVRDEVEARQQVRNLAAKGATAIKIYYRMSLGLIQAAADECKKLGLPSTAHLEISDAREVIQAGVTGIEHVTSFGLALTSPFQAEAYKQKVLADNNARREGRYEMWEQFDFGRDKEKVDAIFGMMVDHGVFFCPTLAVFEEGSETDNVTRQGGFARMMEFTTLAHKSGVDIVVGSHSYVPYSDYGWAYHRELDLLLACGMTPREIIQAATYTNARFFKVEDQLGSVETGKKADLLVLEKNPFEDINSLRDVKRVMLNGVWVE